MLKIDQEIIKDRLAGVSFTFLTDDDIKALSVVEVRNLATFDHLDRPANEGLHDKRMGVSPFGDRHETCATCGQTANFCTGHHGHIELVCPIYNPFMIRDLYRLLKSKCFHCNRLRIHDSKINVFTSALKLIRAGEIVGSAKLKSHFAALVKDVVREKDPNEKQIQKVIDLAATLTYDVSEEEVRDQFKYFTRKFNLERERFEEGILQMMERVCDNEDGLIPDATSIMNKASRDIERELWASVITTRCPHCKKNSPAIRKDGFTKLFVKPLQGRSKAAAEQRKRLESESQTVASTQHNKSRKSSNVDGSDESSSEIDEENEAMDVDDGIENEFKEGGTQKYLTPVEARGHIQALWRKEGNLLDLVYGKFEPTEAGPYTAVSLGSQLFFMNRVLVPPTRFRPESEGSGGRTGTYLHAHSAMLLKVMNANFAMKDAVMESQTKNKAQDTSLRWIQMQDAVNIFMDSSMASKTADKDAGGVRQLLEKKEGMFRMKMMGKRVNYGGRSVISPDPYLTTDQIGVPVFMARRLTFPESVAGFNAERLRQAVMNGAHQHPGANMIEDEETGELTHLEGKTVEERQGLARMLGVGRKVVYRHLRNGDPLLVNRQPTLHKPSIMAHQCRVLPKEQTIRMHYANCSTYNADFDGDEMNIHLPQSYQAFAEAYGIMATHKQYTGPTNGKPLRGLIQDSVIAGVFMTSKDTFLEKDQYNQLVYIGLRELIEQDKITRIESLPPAMIKPKQLWTGKQVISTLLKNIVNLEQEYKKNNLSGLNVNFRSKLSVKEWGPLGVEEGEVVFRDNEHLKGTLDKAAFGSSEFGLVHAFHEVYGSEKAGELLTSLARVFAVFLQTHGFTCGLDDLVMQPEFNKKRRQAIEAGHSNGIKAAAEFCGIKDFEPEQINFSGRVVRQSKGRFDKNIEKLTQMMIPGPKKKCIGIDHPVRQGLEEKMSTAAASDAARLDAQLDTIMQGKMNDATSKVLKEIIPEGLVKKFPKNNLSAMVMTGAKGGVVNQTQISALLGQQSLEGRRVPKMQNGKTLPCYLPYDPNPRSSGYISDRFISGLRPQEFYFHCMAGREGLIDTAVKTSRSGYLQRCLIKQLECLIVNYDMTVRDHDGSVVQFLYGEDAIDVSNNSYLDKFSFLENNFRSLITRSGKSAEIYQKVDKEKVHKFNRRVEKAQERQAKGKELSDKDQAYLTPDPVISLYHPQKYFGSISEAIGQKLSNYLENDCQAMNQSPLKKRFQPIQAGTFRDAYFMKYMKSLISPGENVGTVAAQSVGEPSTQMTLNTFHLAGHAAGNMTLGVPRLKEILMNTPITIKTPVMTLYFKKDCKMTFDQMQKFANQFEKIRLTEIVKTIKVGQTLTRTQAGFSRAYKVELTYDSLKALQANLGVSWKKLQSIFQDNFINALMNEIFRQLKKADAPQQIMKVSTKVDKDEEEKTEAADDSEVSEGEKERADEVNEVDGVTKIAKEARGYDDDSESGDVSMAEAESDDAPVTKDPKVSGRFKQYLSDLCFDEKEGKASVTITFPLDVKKILMLTVAETTMAKVLVRSTPKIEKCTFVKPKENSNEEPSLVVQGLNFEAFVGYQDILDLDRLETNHSYALKNKYGVEAMRANIVKEINMVFGVYGISVNPRHLSLIGDFMTFNGDYRAFNRIGMEESASPFLRMSYETTMKYLVNASVQQQRDDMSAPSSAIVLGQVPRVGTGMFELLRSADGVL